MLDSMCLLSICKQLFAEKVTLRKEAMKAVLEWNIDNSDRSRSQVQKKKNFSIDIILNNIKKRRKKKNIN